MGQFWFHVGVLGASPVKEEVVSSAPRLMLVPDELEGISIGGQLRLTAVHECGPFIGGECLVCALHRLMMDGEQVSLRLVVHDIDDCGV